MASKTCRASWIAFRASAGRCSSSSELPRNLRLRASSPATLPSPGMARCKVRSRSRACSRSRIASGNRPLSKAPMPDWTRRRACSNAAGSVASGRMTGRAARRRLVFGCEPRSRGRGGDGNSIPGQIHRLQAVVQKRQVPEREVGFGSGECEPAARGVKGGILDQAGPHRECEPRLKRPRISQDDSPISPTRRQQPAVGAQCERQNLIVMCTGDEVDAGEIVQIEGAQSPAGIAHEGAISETVDDQAGAALG